MHNKATLLPAALIALSLILFPLLDTAISVWPLRPGEVSWRFGAAGLFSRALMTPLLGVLLVYIVALVLERHRVLRAFAVLNCALAIILVGTVALFALDALQMRAQVRPEVRAAFDAAALVALAKYSFAAIAALTFSVGAWKHAQRETRSRARAPNHADALLMTGKTTAQA